MRERKLFHIFVYCISCVLLAGCAANYGYYYSKPIKKDQSYKFYPNGIVLFELEGVDLFLQPKNNTNFFAGAKMPVLPVNVGKDSEEEFHYSKEYFDIEVVLHAKKEGFLFNPQKVYLTLGNGQRFQPSEFLVKEGAAHWPLSKGPHNLIYYNFNDVWNKANNGSTDNYFHLTKDKNIYGIGFVLRFETATPMPGDFFSVEIKGVRYLDYEVGVSKIEYQDKSRYDWTFF